ncbi:MAG: hypothetical protein KatS3mg009_3185 [Acidimicrobiia bacterium]|nr:MAG: hypothetical protein KatS3mg009_3185 [Acidimicrobiia bacterium]
MSVPDELVGAWRRRSISLGGGAPRETRHVLWLQACDAYADVRIPLGDRDTGSWRAFAGPVTWHAPRLHWHHEIDSCVRPAPDHAVLSWDGAILVERGVAAVGGRRVPYEERWARVDRGHVTLVARSDDGRSWLVRVGRYALALTDGRAAGGAFCARLGVLVGGRWRELWRARSGVRGPGPATPVLAGPWRVVEASVPAR